MIIQFFRNPKLLFLLLIILCSCNDGYRKNESNKMLIVPSHRSDSTESNPPQQQVILLNDWEKENIKGKPLSMRQEEFEYLTDSAIGDRTGKNSETLEFNDYGLVEKTFIYDKNNNLDSRAHTYFSESNKKTRKVFYNRSNSVELEIVYYYNGIGQNDSTVFLFSDNRHTAQRSVYDISGHEVITTMYNFENSRTQTIHTTYLNKHKKKLVMLDKNNIPFAICKYENDVNGNPIKEYYLSGSNILVEEYSNEYTYDELGNWVLKKTYLDSIYVRTTENQDKRKGPSKVISRTFRYN